MPLKLSCAQVKTLVDSILVGTTTETKLEARFVMASHQCRGYWANDAFVSLLSDVPDSPLRQKVRLGCCGRAFLPNSV